MRTANSQATGQTVKEKLGSNAPRVLFSAPRRKVSAAPGTGCDWRGGPPARDWHPGQLPPGRWHDDYFRKPGREFILTAEDRSASHWFAVSAPVKVGFWSYWAGFLERRGAEIAAAAVAGGLAEGAD